MAFRVFLSYSVSPEENALVWRLQTLAAAQGIQVFVPTRPASRRIAALHEEIRNAIDQADCVLAIIAARTDRWVDAELSYALAKHKLIVPIVQEGIRVSLPREFNPVFGFAPEKPPGRVEQLVVEFLRQQRVSKENQQALAALIAIGLGMFVLAELPKK